MYLHYRPVIKTIFGSGARSVEALKLKRRDLRIDLALVEIVILLVAIITNIIMFWRIERLAGLLFVPYAAWVTCATILNASLWLLNET